MATNQAASPEQGISAMARRLTATNTTDSPSKDMTTAPSRTPITCHVLDTTTGLPAQNLAVTLTNLTTILTNPNPPEPTTSSIFTASTNVDGRVTAWTLSTTTTPSSTSASESLEALFRFGRDEGDTQTWSLRFATGEYYGQETFWPEVEVKFWTGRGREHVHVPLLLGPYGYTTYRGS